jgi:hypothetical protein
MFRICRAKKFEEAGNQKSIPFLRWAIRILWSLLGGTWGAWQGFGGYFSVDLNADSFAPVFVLGFYVFSGLLGLIAGATACALIGGLVERVLRYFGVGLVAALCVATLVNVLALWQISAFVQAKYPGLSAERAAKPHRSNKPGEHSPANKGSYRNPCLEQPPADTKERAIWDSECR